jgi:flavin-binding protein dodecin
MAETRWTPSLVEEHFVEAASVMKRLPNVCVPGYFNTWPKMLYEFSDLVGQEPPLVTRIRPSAEAISRMEETLDWLTWLEPIDRKVVWLRASGERWKTVCWKVGLHRAAAHEHWLYALCVIAGRLNGWPGRPTTSKRRLIEQTRLANQPRPA